MKFHRLPVVKIFARTTEIPTLYLYTRIYVVNALADIGLRVYALPCVFLPGRRLNQTFLIIRRARRSFWRSRPNPTHATRGRRRELYPRVVGTTTSRARCRGVNGGGKHERRDCRQNRKTLRSLSLGKTGPSDPLHSCARAQPAFNVDAHGRRPPTSGARWKFDRCSLVRTTKPCRADGRDARWPLWLVASVRK